MDQILPPKSDPPMPQIPPQSNPPRLELLYQEIGEDEPTLKMRVPPELLRETSDQWQRARGPNWGLIIACLFCLAFWGSVYYFIAR